MHQDRFARQRRDERDQAVTQRDFQTALIAAQQVIEAGDSRCFGYRASIVARCCSKQQSIISRVGGYLRPVEGLPVMTIDGESDPHHLAVPRRGRQNVPPGVRAERRDLAIVFAYSPASRVALQQDAVLICQPIDGLGIPKAPEGGVDVPIPVGWTCPDRARKRACQLKIHGAFLRPAPRSGAVAALDDIRACNSESRNKTVRSVSSRRGRCKTPTSRSIPGAKTHSVWCGL